MKKVLRCNYCNYNSEHKEIVAVHEALCPFNPVNRTCESCALGGWDGINEEVIVCGETRHNSEHIKEKGLIGKCEDWRPPESALKYRLLGN